MNSEEKITALEPKGCMQTQNVNGDLSWRLSKKHLSITMDAVPFAWRFPLTFFDDTKPSKLLKTILESKR